MRVTAERLADLLADAKKAHTDWEWRFKEEGMNPPLHKWEVWYAGFIMARLNAEWTEGQEPVWGPAVRAGVRKTHASLYDKPIWETPPDRLEADAATARTTFRSNGPK